MNVTDTNRGNRASKVEVAKRGGRFLRGTIKKVLESDASQFQHDDVQLLKFHGMYQQDNRDTRKQRRAQGLGQEVSFMVRVSIPGGMLSADQYLELDGIADRYSTNGALRLTTRQGIQLHGVVKNDIQGVIAGLNQKLLTTFGACGDVMRNVMCCPAPLGDQAHVTLRRVACEIATHLRPASRAYHEIWLDGEKCATAEGQEPFYGETYLPRKFKAAIALETDNCVDVFSYDVGLIAIVRQEMLEGFDVVVGGGLGMTHGRPDTFARLAEPFGFVKPADAVETVRTVAAVFRDHGNRADRKHARLKYLLAEWGIERFRDEFQRRTSLDLAPYRALAPMGFHDHLGRHSQNNDKWFLGVFVENGRIKDSPKQRLKSALKTVIDQYRPGVTATPQQNLLLTGLDQRTVDAIERVFRAHGVRAVDELSAARRYSMACPALPTCGLALAESERLMPSVLDRLEQELEALGLRDESISVRMTGCPNGCARTYTADIAFVGKGPKKYQMYVGGGLSSDCVVDLYAADVAPDDFIEVLRPLLQRWAMQRRQGEGFGEYYRRLVGHEVPRRSVSGSEEPRQALLSLEVIR